MIEADAQVAEIIPVMTDVMIEAETILDRGLMIGIKGNFLILGRNPEVTVTCAVILFLLEKGGCYSYK